MMFCVALLMFCVALLMFCVALLMFCVGWFERRSIFCSDVSYSLIRFTKVITHWRLCVIVTQTAWSQTLTRDFLKPYKYKGGE